VVSQSRVLRMMSTSPTHKWVDWLGEISTAPRLLLCRVHSIHQLRVALALGTLCVPSTWLLEAWTRNKQILTLRRANQAHALYHPPPRSLRQL